MDEALHALADPTRRRILDLVRYDEMSAGELAARFPEMSRPSVSQHLRVLVGAALLDVRRDGNRRLYRLRRAGLAEAAAFIDGLWSDQLNRLKQAAEAEDARHEPERNEDPEGQA